MIGVLLVVLSSFMAVAEEDSCSGFFGTISCILWGDPQVRSSLAGEAYQRNVVGGATGKFGSGWKQTNSDSWECQQSPECKFTDVSNNVLLIPMGGRVDAPYTKPEFYDNAGLGLEVKEIIQKPSVPKTVSSSSTSSLNQVTYTSGWSCDSTGSCACDAAVCLAGGKKYGLDSLVSANPKNDPAKIGVISEVTFVDPKINSLTKNKNPSVTDEETGISIINQPASVPEDADMIEIEGIKYYADQKSGVVWDLKGNLKEGVNYDGESVGPKEGYSFKNGLDTEKVVIPDLKSSSTTSVSSAVYGSGWSCQGSECLCGNSGGCGLGMSTVGAGSKITNPNVNPSTIDAVNTLDIKPVAKTVEIISTSAYSISSVAVSTTVKINSKEVAVKTTTPKSSSTPQLLTADVDDKTGNIVIKKGTAKTGDTYVPVSGQSTKGSGPDDKKVYKYSKNGKTSEEYYVEHEGELVRVQLKDGAYKYSDGKDVVKDVRDATKSTLVDGKKIKLLSDAKTGKKKVEDKKDVKKVADTPADAVQPPLPIVDSSSGGGANTDKTISEYKPLACSGADVDKCKLIISSHVGSGQLLEWEEKKGGIDWSQVQLYEQKTSYPNDATHLEKGEYFTVHFTNKEFASVRKANTGVAVIELHSEPVKGKDGTEKSHLKEVSYVMAGQVIATQSADEASSGKVTVNGQSYFVDTSKPIEEVLADTKGGKLDLYGTKEEMEAAKDPKSGVKPLVVLETSGISGTAGTGSGAVKITDDGTLTDTIVTTVSKGGKVESVETTYDDVGISGWSGTIKEYDDKGKETRTLTKDVQLQDVGDEEKPKDAQLYYNGVQVGAEHYDEKGVLTEKYIWEVNYDKESNSYSLKSGSLKDKTGIVVSSPPAEVTESIARANTQAKLSSIYSFTNQLKSYPAISQALYGDTEFYKSWRDNADRAFAPMMGSSWFPSAVCDEEGYKRDIESNEGVAFVKSPSGSYQAVAAVKGERTKQLSPLLCARNPDEAAKELFICGEGQVCGTDQLCYADADEDGEPDVDKKGKAVPLQGYMYKISWAVTAPGDERLTPFVTEKGAAISFNIFIDKNKDGDVSNGIALYTVPWIELKNGEHDADVLIQFEKDDAFKEVCIKWDKAPATTPSPFSAFTGVASGAGGVVGGVVGGAVGTASAGISGGPVSGLVRFVGNAGGYSNDKREKMGAEMIPTICSEIKESDVGTVVWTPTGDGAAKEDTPSDTVSGGKIGRKASWG